MTQPIVIFCAVGSKRYIDQAISSARSVKESNPTVKTVVFTDHAGVTDCFDEVRIVTESGNGFVAKISAITHAPYDRFLYLDSDTYVAGDLLPVFALLDRFDVAAAHALSRYCTKLDHVPLSFPELNTGVLAVRRSETVNGLLGAWLCRYREHRDRYIHLPTEDQPALRELLWESDLRIAVLTPEWNCMFHIGTGITGEARIFHGTSSDYKSLVGRINHGQLHPFNGLPESRWCKEVSQHAGILRRSIHAVVPERWIAAMRRRIRK
jgi:hypothetical protein